MGIIKTHRKRGVGSSRRNFLIGTAAAGGLIMGYSLLGGLGRGPVSAARAAAAFEPNIWFTMDDKGIATVHVVKAEMGQHVGTAIAQALAEELEVAWENVRIDYPSTAPQWGLFVTGGSWSINWTFDQMSRAGAAGRIALMEGAVARFGVPLAELTAENGWVVHAKSGRKVSYAELVAGGLQPRKFTEAELKGLQLKDPAKRKYVGKSVPALDVPAKSRGAADFGIDVKLDGMAYGTPLVPPVRYGATVKSVDDSEAKKIPGYMQAVVIEDPTRTVTGWVVAVADSYYTALKATQALKVAYDMGPNATVSTDAIMAEAKKQQADPSAGQLFVKDGDAAAAIKGAAKTHEATYTTSLNIHAPLEPMNCTAQEVDGVWNFHCGNQFQTLALGLLPPAMGVSAEQVVVHQKYLGGGFGRRLDSDYLIVAGLTAKAVGKPVKVIYSREADTLMDFPRSATYQVMRAGIGADNRIVGVQHDVVSAWATARQAPAFLADSADKKGKLDPFSVNGADHWYSIPNHSVRLVQNPVAQSATPPGHLRAVAPGWTFWAGESFLDEIAHMTEQDPVKLRLALLDGAGKNAGSAPMAVGGARRLANVLEVAAKKAGWGGALPKNTGLGVACVSSQERTTPTWTACVARVAVDPASGQFKVEKLTVVADVGTAVNPDGVMAQLEGSSLWGVSIATKEFATMKDGAFEQDNYDTYTPLRMEEMPELDIEIVSPGHYPVGCGEPAVTVVAPAIANAIHAAVGARVRSLPITPEKVKAAMKA
jgi:isoquinoline 1-oxidoreductase